jgi:hypothetical protein
MSIQGKPVAQTALKKKTIECDAPWLVYFALVIICLPTCKLDTHVFILYMVPRYQLMA